ncbi:MAG: phosphoribosylglycinamide formyltransferase 2 [Gammaproteobacteria bacterium]|nr:phosphoribosylglycinamide formyltransferase 2 [Gammaproteobacteria bacterium]MBK80212.1 phosphoribosylglycinamide formyltransferase 2 [Gammaproteobacteria bacterium]
MSTPDDTVIIGTAGAASATRVMLLGSGELGKEVVIELQRLGVETIAVDRYAGAPAMQVAHRSHVVDMLDGAALRALIEEERPHYVVPEIEAIATPTLVELAAEGHTIVPTARATRLTMDREGIRRLVAEELGERTSPYRFAASEAQYRRAVDAIGLPCVVKPVMSSSGKGQSLVREAGEVDAAWRYAQGGARGRAGGDGDGTVIVEGFVPFDYEITLLTVRHAGGDSGAPARTSFCPPIGHRQEGGDYRESWQPQPMPEAVLAECQRVAERVTEALGGFGLFGVEFFIAGDEVYFSEVSPRPHDTGMVTLISQDLSEFALHARAILGLPIPNVRSRGPSASAVIMVSGDSADVSFAGLERALEEPDTQIRLFGKPEVRGERRMGVALALGEDVDRARARARAAAAAVRPRTA